MDSRLQAEFDEVRSETRGETTFGITSWRSSIMLPTLLPVLHDRYPHIRVNVSEGRSYTFESAMLNGQVDFCLVPYPAHFNMATTHEDMGREKLYLAGNRSHPAVQKALDPARAARTECRALTHSCSMVNISLASSPGRCSRASTASS